MKKLLTGTLLALSVGLPGPAPAAPDHYIGDTAIYTGESTSIRPNILLIVDNSNTAANEAGAGMPYDPDQEYSGAYGRYDIWKAGQQGEFTHLEVQNADATMPGLTCSNNNNVIRETLVANGTYVGRGTADYPSIKNGGCDTKKAYTYATGNYLNYLATPAESTTAKQYETVNGALAQVLAGARYAANFGLMVYDNGGQKGGKVLVPVSDLSTDAALQGFLDHLPGSGTASDPGFLSSQTARPQAEALLDAGHYFRGEPLPISGQSAMASPITQECDINYIVLITNGLSNKDDDGALWGTVGDYDGDGQEAAVTINYGTGGTHFLDDVAKYLYETDASPLDDLQRIVTATILAFQNDDELVRRAGLSPAGEETADPDDRGVHGRGGYYNVFNANELADALMDLLANIVAEADTSFVAPVVPASTTNRTISSNRVYIGLFKPQSQKPWIGNLKKYGVNSQNQLVDRDGNAANDVNGDFIPNSLSYWGTNASGDVMTFEGPRSNALGDGGQVDAGGVGGTLLARIVDGNAPRKIYTYLGGSTDLTDPGNAFTVDNLTAANSGIADDGKRAALVDYFNGIDVFDDDEDSDFSDTRPWIMGDILHSKPLVFNYTAYPATEENTCYNPLTGTGNSTVIYVGSNDGMFHAFRDCDGEELWAFVPDNLLPDLPSLMENAHTYFVDNSPTAYVHDYADDGEIDTGFDSKDRVILIVGQRRGGGKSHLTSTDPRGAYYALDVTQFDRPRLLWKRTSADAGFEEMGETWSQARLARVKVNSGSGDQIKVVAIVGAGYDNNEDLRFGSTQRFPEGITEETDISNPTYDSGNVTSDNDGSQVNPRGRGVFVIEVATLAQDAAGKFVPDFTGSGSMLKTFVHGASAPYDQMEYSFPSDPTVLDLDADGYHDTVYIGDTGGHLWRIEIDAPDTDQWTAEIIFDSNPGADGSRGRKIFSKPSVALIDGHPVLYFGTGDRAHPLNTAVTDRLYAVRDRGQVTSDAIRESGDLVDLTANALQADNTTTSEIEAILASLHGSTNYGWYIKLNENDGEKVLAPGVVFNKNVFYTTYSPNVGVAPDPCSPGNLGTSRLYHIDYATGEAVYNYDDDNDGANNNERAATEEGYVLRRSDRVREIGVGIPSGIVTMIDASGKVTMMTSSSNRVNTYSAPESKLISPVYWIEW